MPNLDLYGSTGRMSGCSNGAGRRLAVGVLICALCLMPVREAFEVNWSDHVDPSLFATESSVAQVAAASSNLWLGSTATRQDM